MSLLPSPSAATGPGAAGASAQPLQARNFRIDILRGIAISLVLLLHFHLSYSLLDSPLAAVLPAEFIKAVARNGNYGVTMFFVVSGYLITSTTLRRYGSLGNVDVRSFYAFRFARIVPCLVVALVVIVVLGLLKQPAFMNVAKPGWPEVGYPVAVLSVLSFWHNVLMQHAWYFNYAMNIYWSLSVEEVFYLAFPLLCFGLKRQWAIVAVWVLAIVVGPIYRSFHTDDEIYFMYGYLACFDAVAFGCCAALLAQRFSLGSWGGRQLQLAAACLVAVTYLRGIQGNEVFGFTAIAAGTAVLLIGAHNERVPGWALRSRALAGLRWLGRHSYELYLFHIIVLGLMRSFVPRGAMPAVYKLPAMVFFVAASVLVAWGVARFYSEPMNARLRAFLLRGRAAL
ncbi:acyltransferase family protein [Variovorax sp. PAMC26660]|uniref:acyltransferase family protein n=1 Tax=Variovorax sp. PAMC26660 TaxID=2762322 RepID=UPI00164DB3E2|nr:acyltransferase [Variovorax sp. PAMC26660]QNK66963.1 acyltransferase [Variovorax sp. PAMC26660]